MGKIESKKALQSKRFVIRKALLGKGKKVEFTDYDGKKWTYDHDEVFKAHEERFEAMKCWHKYKYYSQTFNMPKFILEDGTGVETDYEW